MSSQQFGSIFYSLSFYSPLIISFSTLMLSIFTQTLEKAFAFFICVFIITFVRIIGIKGLTSGLNNNNAQNQIPQICLTGLTQSFIPHDVLYSTYILSFSLMYFVLPMILVSKQHNINAINYGVLAFFISYIALDLFVKKSLFCIGSLFSSNVIGNLLSGLGLGAFIVVIMYGTSLKQYLYMNELNSNKEVCSTKAKQQFRCSVYKNGELVGNV